MRTAALTRSGALPVDRPPRLRTVEIVAAVLFAIAGALVLLSFFALENLWADYQDSQDSTYIEVAALELTLAAAAAVGGALALRKR